MDNQDRIRKWRQERASRTVKHPELVDEPVEAFGPAPGAREKRVTGDASPAAEAVAATPDIEEARLAIVERRRAHWRKIAQRVLLFAVAPLLAILFYLWLVATPLYQGEAVFTVQTSNSAAPAPTAGIFSMTGGGNSTIADAFKAREYILSRPMMDHMEERYGLMSHFASSEMDPLTRFQGPLGLNEEPLPYYQKRVRVAVDVQEGLLRLYVQARTPQDALRFGNGILAAAEAHVNAFSEKISDDQISALTRDVENAERRVADTRRSLAAVQARRGDISPQQTAAAVYQLISSLELQLAEAESERNTLLEQGLTNSPLLPPLNARVQELRSQIAEQRQRLANPSGGSLVRTMNEYESASARKEIAQARWESTLNTLQEAYQRILEQRRYFVIVVGLSVGEFPEVRDILAIVWPILLLLAMIYAITFFARRARLEGRSFPAWRIPDVVSSWRRR